ncbi:hypothetical protein ILYODFUR_034402 [Ilyodon furcidens]|uniref:Uncharacterized protein n=1 Tax=Ilyodon furcidens TaxID=33524 RepID=A0ABV0SSL9_9TELE
MMTARVGRGPIRDFCEYDSERDKCQCLVVETDDKVCGILLKRKNPTNLKVHLRSAKRADNCEYQDKLASLTSCAEKRGHIEARYHRQKGNNHNGVVSPSTKLLVSYSQDHHKQEDASVRLWMSTPLCVVD